MKRITVKTYMTQKSTPLFDFMEKWNNDNPMPLRVMYGRKVDETKGMVKMQLHGDLLVKEGPVCNCMKCGKPITNPVSRYFGIGPVCGQHGYVNPFDSDEELEAAVEQYREKLKEITWTGWIIKSAIVNEEDIEGDDEEVEELSPTVEATVNKDVEFKVVARIAESNKIIAEHSAYLSFPYNYTAVALVKAEPERVYYPETKEWEIPYEALDEFTENLKSQIANAVVEVNDEVELLSKQEVHIPQDFKFFTEPMQHQIEGVEYGLNHDRWLLGDEQGLGKSKQIIDLARVLEHTGKIKHCLVVVGVNNLKWNWRNEILKHGHQKSYILGQRVRRRKGGRIDIEGTAAKIEDLQKLENGKLDSLFLITNIESLRIPKLANYLAKLCQDGIIDMVVVDESHKAKNSFSLQGSGLLKLESKYRISLSGTPMLNTPLDLYTTFKWLGFEPYSFWSFRKYFCQMGGYEGKEIVGYKNLHQLKGQLDRIMLRRTKNDVLDLPDKLYIDEYVEMNKAQSDIYYEVKQQILAEVDKIKVDPNPLSKMIRLRQATGYTGILSTTVLESAKFERAYGIVEAAVAEGKKAVIFSNWSKMIYPAAEYLKEFNPVVITGDVADEERPEIADKFQYDEDVKVILGTTSAMGTGLTLTAGTVVIFLDEPASDALREQAIDRCHRFGTTDTVKIYMLMVANTIDERIHSLCDMKGELFANIVDDKDLPESIANRIKSSPSALVDYLLS